MQLCVLNKCDSHEVLISGNKQKRSYLHVVVSNHLRNKLQHTRIEIFLYMLIEKNVTMIFHNRIISNVRIQKQNLTSLT